MPEDKSNVAFYVKHGFQEFEGAGSIIICNPGKKGIVKNPISIEGMGLVDNIIFY